MLYMYEQQQQRKRKRDEMEAIRGRPDLAEVLRLYLRLLFSHVYSLSWTASASLERVEALLTRAQAPCEICGKVEDDANALLCDRCDHAFHIYCLTPPLDSVPAVRCLSLCVNIMCVFFYMSIRFC
jgi:hypothetical protein